MTGFRQARWKVLLRHQMGPYGRLRQAAWRILGRPAGGISLLIRNARQGAHASLSTHKEPFGWRARIKCSSCRRASRHCRSSMSMLMVTRRLQKRPPETCGFRINRGFDQFESTTIQAAMQCTQRKGFSSIAAAPFGFGPFRGALGDLYLLKALLHKL